MTAARGGDEQAARLGDEQAARRGDKLAARLGASSRVLSRLRSPRLWLRLLLLAILVAALLLLVDLREVWRTIAAVSAAGIAAALLLATAARVMMGYKWRQLILAAGGRLRLWHAVSAYYQAAFAGRVVPVGMGQDVLRAYLVGRMGLPGGLLLSSIAIEKLLAVLANVLLALLGMLYLTSRLPPDTRGMLLLAAGAVLAASVGALALALHRGSHRLGARLLRGRLSGKLASALRRASTALLAYRKRPGTLALNLLLALSEQMLQLLKFVVLGRALGIEMPIVGFLAVVAVVLFARRVTAYLEGWGLSEATSVVLFMLMGIERETAVALALTNYAVATVATLPGAVLLYRSGIGSQWRGQTPQPSP